MSRPEARTKVSFRIAPGSPRTRTKASIGYPPGEQIG